MALEGNASKAYRGAAQVIAMVATVFIAPVVWEQIKDPLWPMLLESYDRSTASILHLGLWGATYIASFYLIQLTIYTAITSAVLVAALRFV